MSGRQFASYVYGSNRPKSQRPFEGSAPLRNRDARNSQIVKPKEDSKSFWAKANW